MPIVTGTSGSRESNPTVASTHLLGTFVAEKNKFPHANGVNFNDHPAWEKRGAGMRWMVVTKAGRNPLTGATVPVTRRRLQAELALPMLEDYFVYIAEVIDGEKAVGDLNRSTR